MENILNIYTCCDGIYKDFTPLFILSNIHHNDSCFVEIGVDDKNYEKTKKSLSLLKEMYPNKFLIYNVKFGNQKVSNQNFNCLSNTIRFFNTPVMKTKYVYISDVDIITLQKNLHEIHIQNMVKTKLPYSNIVRPKSNRLSGLHFTPYENYYPVPKYLDLCQNGFLMHDEVFLYELVKKRFPNFNFEETFRPVHGIHVSLNREPEGKLNWGMKNWKSQWQEFRTTNNFKIMEQHFTDMIKTKINIIDNYYK
jgi:hypothetical protein